MPQMQANTRATLELLVEKARLLTSRRFIDHIQERGGLSISLSVQAGQPITTSDNMPDEEATHALALTLRMFLQNNDRISLGNLGNIADPGVSARWKEIVDDVRNSLNGYLDAPHPRVKLKMLDGSLPTRRDILEALLYGDLAHSNEKKRAQVQAWQAMGPAWLFVAMAFNEIVVVLINAIAFIASATEYELRGDEIPDGASDEDSTI